jgi:hypothetical protein
VSRRTQDTPVPGFDYRPDREPGQKGTPVIWTVRQWHALIEASVKAGGRVDRFKEKDGTHTTTIRTLSGHGASARLDACAEAYGL